MRQHRVRLAGDCTAVRFDGFEWPLGGHRRIALGDQPVVFPLVGQRAKGQGRGHTASGNNDDGHEGGAHVRNVSPAGRRPGKESWQLETSAELLGGAGF